MSTDGRALAVSLVPLETRRAAIVHIATTADRLGYDAFFLPEAWAYDGTVLLAELVGAGMPGPLRPDGGAG